MRGEVLCDHPMTVLNRETTPLPLRVQGSPMKNEEGRLVGSLQTFHLVENPDRDTDQDLILFELEKKLGRSPELRKVYEILPDLARSDAPVLIHGEPGTGTRELARAIHRLSGRGTGPFHAVACREQSQEELTRSLLGAPEEAVQARHPRSPGILERANGGTVFLRDIGALPSSLQVHVLRAVERHVFTPVETATQVKVDIRLVASTETGLESLVRSGRFRENLFYCLNVFRIHLPPLRTRAGDVRELAEDCLLRLSMEHGSRVKGMERAVVAALQAYPLPGNNRELVQILTAAFRKASGAYIGTQDLPSAISRAGFLRPGDDAGGTGAGSSRGGEGSRILSALIRNQWSRKRAAQDLGMDRTTLWRKMKRLGIPSAAPPRGGRG